MKMEHEFQRPWQVRACPADFAETFIREGWRGVEAKYGFHTRINKRCIAEAGGEDLIRRRREYMAQVRKLRKSIQHRHETTEPPQIVPESVRSAITFMRGRDGGSWLITATGVGDFYFGATRLTGEQIMERAKRKGWSSGDDWSAEEDGLLREIWGTLKAQEVTDMLPGRNMNAVRCRATRLGLRGGKE